MDDEVVIEILTVIFLIGMVIVPQPDIRKWGFFTVEEKCREKCEAGELGYADSGNECWCWFEGVKVRHWSHPHWFYPFAYENGSCVYNNTEARRILQ